MFVYQADQIVARCFDVRSLISFFLLAVSGQAIPPITVEEIVALGEKILITNVCGESSKVYSQKVFLLALY